jgi:hypothetical protein
VIELGRGRNPIAGFGQVTIFEVNDAIGDIENAIVVGDKQNGAVFLLGEVVE